MSLQKLPNIILAGVIVGMLASLSTISYATLVYKGALSSYLLTGMSSALLGTVCLMLLLGLSSSSKQTIAQAQDVVAVIAAMLLSKIATEVLAIHPEQVLSTVLAATLLMALCMGLSMFLLGHLHLGKLVRYFPYPVIGGFLAGTGWMILVGTFTVLTLVPVNLSNLGSLFTSPMLWYWLPAFFYAALMIYCVGRFRHYLIYPGFLCLAILLFYGFMRLKGWSFAEAAAMHLFLGPFPEGPLLSIPSLQLHLGQVHWGIILSYLPSYVTLVILSVISLLLNVSAFEIVAKENMDVDQELKATGLANFAVAAVAGFGGYQSLGLSRNNQRFEADSRAVSCLAALVILFLLWTGTGLLTHLPRFAFGALLFYTAMNFIMDWIVRIKRKLSWPDYLIILAIAGCIAIQGLLAGVLLGLVLSLILFFVKYSRIEVLRAILNGAILHSNVDRNEHERAILQRKGGSIMIPVISGYLFFGNSAFLVQRFIAAIEKEQQSPIRFVAVDFLRISGMEASCYVSFIKFLQYCKGKSILVLFANLPLEVKRDIGRFIKAEAESLDYREFHDLDRAIEWCEDRLIREELVSSSHCKDEAPMLDGFANATELLPYFEKITKKAGELVYVEGEASADLLWLLEGHLDVVLGHATAKELRLYSIKAGAIVGEMGFFLKQARSATVLAKQDSVLYRLTESNLQRLSKENPQLAQAFQGSVIQLLGKRLEHANQFIRFVKARMIEGTTSPDSDS